MRYINLPSSKCLAFLCTEEGQFIKVLKDDLNLLTHLKPGQAAGMLFHSASIGKWNQFLKDICHQQAAFGCQMEMLAPEQPILLHFAGGMHQNFILVVAAINQPDISLYFFEELMHINNEEINALRQLMKEQMMKGQADKEQVLFNDLTALNNELVTLQRDVSKKNAALEQHNKEIAALAELVVELQGIDDMKQAVIIIHKYARLLFPESMRGSFHLLTENDPPRFGYEPPSAPLPPEIANLAATFIEYVNLSLNNLYLRQELQKQALIDPLTGLYNRRFMYEMLSKFTEQARRTGDPVSLILIDLDHFKRINDTYGHPVGDLVLQVVADLLLRSVRRSDVACRYGGEEFLLIMPFAQANDAGRRAEQLRSALHEFRMDTPAGVVENLSFSAGVAAYPVHASNIEDLLQRLDEALYKAKHAGRDQVTIAPEG